MGVIKIDTLEEFDAVAKEANALAADRDIAQEDEIIAPRPAILSCKVSTIKSRLSS